MVTNKQAGNQETKLYKDEAAAFSVFAWSDMQDEGLQHESQPITPRACASGRGRLIDSMYLAAAQDGLASRGKVTTA